MSAKIIYDDSIDVELIKSKKVNSRVRRSSWVIVDS